MVKTIHAINIFIKGENSNTFLAIKRSSSDKLFPDMFALPGGGINENEDILSAGYREFIEETGEELESIEKIPSIISEIKFDSFTLFIQVHIGKLKNAIPHFNPKDKDIQFVTWITPREFINSIKHNGYPLEEVQKFISFLKDQGIDIV